jgi:hypothetical protein
MDRLRHTRGRSRRRHRIAIVRGERIAHPTATAPAGVPGLGPGPLCCLRRRAALPALRGRCSAGANCESDGVRALSCRNLTRIDVVPMQGIDARRAAWRFCCSSNSAVGVSWSRASTVLGRAAPRSGKRACRRAARVQCRWSSRAGAYVHGVHALAIKGRSAVEAVLANRRRRGSQREPDRMVVAFAPIRMVTRARRRGPSASTPPWVPAPSIRGA